MAKKKTTKVAKPDGPPPSDSTDPTEPRLTKMLLTRLLWVNDRRKQLEREARKLNEEEKLLRDVVFSWLEDRSLTTIKKFGIRVSQVTERVVVPWRQAFIRECGPEAADKLTSSSPVSVSLRIASED